MSGAGEPGPGVPGGAGPVDSGGTPFAGRTLTPTPFAGDDGAVDPALGAALAPTGPGGAPSRGASGEGAASTDARGARSPGGTGPDRPRTDVAAVHAALMEARVFVPVLAVAAGGAGPDGAGRGGTDHGAEGPGGAGDGDGADMALPVLRAPDGREAMPVFSSVAALAAWDAAARPVPALARRTALVAVQEGRQLLVLDPAGPTTVVLPRPALWALAQGRAWTPAPRDARVADAVREAASRVGGVLSAGVAPGRRAELRVVLTVVRDLDRPRLRALTDAVSAALAASEVVAERVDSLELELVPAPA